jgi:hypothetical protein
VCPGAWASSTGLSRVVCDLGNPIRCAVSSIDIAVQGSRRLERILEERYGAEGKGLTEKLASVSDRVPSQLHRDLRWVARMRNRVVHEEGVELDNPERFQALVDSLANDLEHGQVEEASDDEEYLIEIRAEPAQSGRFGEILRNLSVAVIGLFVALVLLAYGPRFWPLGNFGTFMLILLGLVVVAAVKRPRQT